jgi:hypothetical protein
MHLQLLGSFRSVPTAVAKRSGGLLFVDSILQRQIAEAEECGG